MNTKPLDHIDVDLAKDLMEYYDKFPSDACFMHRHLRNKEEEHVKAQRAYDLMWARGY